jgi:hypothetical protein
VADALKQWADVIVDYYRNHRIDVNAVQADDRWNAEVRTLRCSRRTSRTSETVTCLKLRADHAEYSALIWARLGST